MGGAAGSARVPSPVAANGSLHVRSPGRRRQVLRSADSRWAPGRRADGRLRPGGVPAVRPLPLQLRLGAHELRPLCLTAGPNPDHPPGAWRREGDSNPRDLAARWFSRPVHSSALPSLRWWRVAERAVLVAGAEGGGGVVGLRRNPRDLAARWFSRPVHSSALPSVRWWRVAEPRCLWPGRREGAVLLGVAGTPGTLRPAGFQDQCIRPLCHRFVGGG